jgi:hypothetical protein
VDTGVPSYAPVAILAQSIDAADCTRAAASGTVGSAGFEGTNRTAGAGVAPPIASEHLLRDQVIRGTSSIGCCAAEDADGIAPG